MFALVNEIAAQAVVGSIVLAFRRLICQKAGTMSARSNAPLSVTTQLSFFSHREISDTNLIEETPENENTVSTAVLQLSGVSLVTFALTRVSDTDVSARQKSLGADEVMFMNTAMEASRTLRGF